MPFDAAGAQAELDAHEARIAALEADGADDDEVLDAICEMNELRDLIRNFESFPPLWDESWTCYGAGPVSIENYVPDAGHGCCLALRSLLAPSETALLREAVLYDPRPEDAEDMARTNGNAAPGFASQADDALLAGLLWERIYPSLPAEVYPAANTPEALLEVQWVPLGVNGRFNFRRILGAGSEPPFHADVSRTDDREDGRPLLSIIANLGIGWGSGADELQVDFLSALGEGMEDAPPYVQEVLLHPGDAVVFTRGDSYRLRGVDVNADVVTCSGKVMYAVTAPMSSELGVME